MNDQEGCCDNCGEEHDELRFLLEVNAWWCPDCLRNEYLDLLDENDRLKEERAVALNVKTKEGLTASEWLLRTGKAERDLAAGVDRLQYLCLKYGHPGRVDALEVQEDLRSVLILMNALEKSEPEPLPVYRSVNTLKPREESNMERYVDTFVRENPRREDESEADYLHRFFEWMVEHGATWPGREK